MLGVVADHLAAGAAPSAGPGPRAAGPHAAGVVGRAGRRAGRLATIAGRLHPGRRGATAAGPAHRRAGGGRRAPTTTSASIDQRRHGHARLRRRATWCGSPTTAAERRPAVPARRRWPVDARHDLRPGRHRDRSPARWPTGWSRCSVGWPPLAPGRAHRRDRPLPGRRGGPPGLDPGPRRRRPARRSLGTVVTIASPAPGHRPGHRSGRAGGAPGRRAGAAGAPPAAGGLDSTPTATSLAQLSETSDRGARSCASRCPPACTSLSIGASGDLDRPLGADRGRRGPTSDLVHLVGSATPTADCPARRRPPARSPWPAPAWARPAWAWPRASPMVVTSHLVAQSEDALGADLALATGREPELPGRQVGPAAGRPYDGRPARIPGRVRRDQPGPSPSPPGPSHGRPHGRWVRASPNRWEGDTTMAPVVTMRQLLEAGVHFGHQTRRWNPKMKRFIYGERNGIYIIDLQQTLGRIETAYTLRPRPRRRRRHGPVRRHQEAGPGPGPVLRREVRHAVRQRALAGRHAHQLRDHLQARRRR